MTSVKDSLELRGGKILKNRFAKSAMSENMAKSSLPGVEFENAYHAWASGGVGLCVTGNVMVDRANLGEFNNVVLDEQVTDLSPFKNWANAAKQNDTICYMQLNHPGKQTPKFLTKKPVAPSAVPLGGTLQKAFNTPRALFETEIYDIIKMFGVAAKKAKESGFDGVQIHAAHGYLVSQFLSPIHNIRNDIWGGNLENRMRFLLEVYIEIRKQVGETFGVGIKLNSADFQKGGFTEEESMQVVKKLDNYGMDFIEVSGGTYEVNAMMGKGLKKYKKESTQKREAYFIEYAKKIKSEIQTPLMLTGGFRNFETCFEAVDSGHVDIVGMGRPFCVYPDLVNQFYQDPNFKIDITAKKLGVQALDAMIPLEIIWYTQQIHRMGKEKNTRPDYNVWFSALETLWELGAVGLRRSRS